MTLKSLNMLTLAKQIIRRKNDDEDKIEWDSNKDTSNIQEEDYSVDETDTKHCN